MPYLYQEFAGSRHGPRRPGTRRLNPSAGQDPGSTARRTRTSGHLLADGLPVRPALEQLEDSKYEAKLSSSNPNIAFLEQCEDRPLRADPWSPPNPTCEHLA